MLNKPNKLTITFYSKIWIGVTTTRCLVPMYHSDQIQIKFDNIGTTYTLLNAM